VRESRQGESDFVAQVRGLSPEAVSPKENFHQATLLFAS
jgi:hypothetical protein